MTGLFNEDTETVHGHDLDEPPTDTERGVTSTVSHDELQVFPVEQALDSDDASKCGRCFGNGGGHWLVSPVTISGHC